MCKEEIYERMTMQFVQPDPEIPCVFDDGKPCAELYNKVCDARLRLSKRTGIDFENSDLREIIGRMEDIARLCSLQMYDYGVCHSAQQDK